MAGKSFRLIRSKLADADIAAIRDYTVRNYGKETAKAYNALLRQAFRDIRDDPFRASSRERADIGPGVRSYHMALSRERAGSTVRYPRHFILYYQFDEDRIAISRVLHDSRDVTRHVPAFDMERAEAFKKRQRGKTRDTRET